MKNAKDNKKSQPGVRDIKEKLLSSKRVTKNNKPSEEPCVKDECTPIPEPVRPSSIALRSTKDSIYSFGKTIHFVQRQLRRHITDDILETIFATMIEQNSLLRLVLMTSFLNRCNIPDSRGVVIVVDVKNRSLVTVYSKERGINLSAQTASANAVPTMYFA